VAVGSGVGAGGLAAIVGSAGTTGGRGVGVGANAVGVGATAVEISSWTGNAGATGPVQAATNKSSSNPVNTRVTNNLVLRSTPRDLQNSSRLDKGCFFRCQVVSRQDRFN
jgi:hypothetical protein